MGVFEQHLSAETLLKMPHLYKSGQRQEHFNGRLFWLWSFNGFVHSIILFFLPRGSVLG